MDGNAEDVNDFLQRIKELGDRKDREDNERNRRLEADILAGREARRARRDERARSISPQKNSPMGTPSSFNSSVSSPRATAGDADGTDAALDRLSGKTFDATDGRNGSGISSEERRYTPTLSWQRRPKSMHVSSLSSRNSSFTTGLDDSNEPEEKSRAQITESLGSKDPTWFRQTPDRNSSSGALRKTEDESMEMTSRMALPGMSPGDRTVVSEPTPEPEKRSSVDNISRNDTPKLERLSNPPNLSHHSRNASLTNANSALFETISTDGFMRPTAMSPSQGRMSPERRERTPSPTKGLGGFVQSAMLKREGSVNKRWGNTQSLSRNNSTATNKPTYPTPRDSLASSISRESSPAPDDSPDNEGDESDLSGRVRSHSISEHLSKASTSGEGLLGRSRSMRRNTESTPPASPTKALEQKRWSPTKSSWLESALKKGTDNPQPAKTPPPPMKPLIPIKPLKPVEKTPPTPPTSSQKSNELIPAKPAVNPKPLKLTPKFSETTPEKQPDDPTPEKSELKTTLKPDVAEKPSVLNRVSLISSPVMRRSPSPEKLEFPRKPAPGPKEINFRANLKPRAQPSKGGEKQDTPFLDAMARLRAAKTQNYKAPDVLKKNILEGKANLATTGGPQKSNRPDPLKETILSARSALGKKPVELPAKAEPADRPRITKQTSAPAKIEVGLKNSSLANRFNPNLANLLQRAPPSATGARPTPARTGTEGNLISSASRDIEGQSQESQSGTLTHMTKGRARGPKRRAPTKAVENTPPTTASPVKPKLPAAPAKIAEPTSIAIEKPIITTTPQKSEKQKPHTPAKSPLLRGDSSSSFKETPKSISEEKIKTPPPIAFPSSKVLTRKASGSLPVTPSSQASSSLKSPVEDKEKDLSTPIKTTKPFGIGITGLSPVGNPPSVIEPLGSRPLPKLPSRSPSPQPQIIDPRDNSQVLSEFFNGPSFVVDRVDLDIIGFLSTSPAIRPENVRTVKMEVSEITGYGKVSPLVEDRQHILFDESMYLSIHKRQNLSGNEVAEVYLWSGNKVSEGAIEDAQLFARKTARKHDCKLIQLKQGRETSTFFQAIGGILITRRGKHSESPFEGTFMLCGRIVFGGVAFDEVDVTVRSLCSGYPHILAQNGVVNVWKGKGATNEEIGAARLVSFEISGGELREFHEGDEPEDFFTGLGGYESRTSADYWQLRPSCSKYAARLFKINLLAPGKVTEIMPFCQGDLDPHEIYVADAFFEFYIVLGSQSQSKQEEFQVALQFTQEFAMLAVSIEDRPFLPVSSVILGGAPREFKALFRTWEDSKIPTTWLPTRKPSLRVIGMTDAMEALGI